MTGSVVHWEIAGVVVQPMPIDDSMSFAMFADPAGNMVGLLRSQEG